MARIVYGLGASHSPMLTLEGKRWSERAADDMRNASLNTSDGLFGRYLPGFGRYTLRVTAEGEAPVEQTIEVTAEQGRASPSSIQRRNERNDACVS